MAEAQLEAVKTERELLIAELTTLRMNACSYSTPTRLHPTASYDGGKNLYEFINQMRMMLRTYKHTFTSETQKIDYVSMRLVGGALSWFTALTNIQDTRVSQSVE